MTSYVYNPSKKVTELLSQYVAFDPEQLQLGIWSGNLELSDVDLRPEALHPLLGRPDHQPPLRLRLISGKIGHFKLKIPWKRLVWGNGDVQVDLQQVTLVLGLDVSEEELPEEEEEKVELPIMDRPTKQKRLREAERRLFQGKSLAKWLEVVRQKAPSPEQTEFDSVQTPEGRMEQWLKSATSDFFWRFYAGLQMNVQNVKIVLVQDGVEVGIIIPSLKVGPKDPKKTVAEETSDPVGETPPENVVYQSEFDDGEHVDKVIHNLGTGVYVRKIYPYREMLDVTTKQYILRPTDIEFSFSLFYPYPPEKRSKRKSQPAQVLDDTATAVSSMGSSKRRRGKREKDAATVTTEQATTDVSGTVPPAAESVDLGGADLQKSLVSHGSGPGHRRTASNVPMHKRRMSMVAPLPSSSITRTVSSKQVTAPSSEADTLPLIRPVDLGTEYSAATIDSQAMNPRLDAHLKVGDVQVVCSTVHYDLLSLFFASVAKMRNGRPAVTIRSVLDEGQVLRRSLTIDTSSSAIAALADNSSTPRASGKGQLRLELRSARSERSEVVLAWWKYAFGVVSRELQQRRRLRKKFQMKYLSFDWGRQRHRRREYVNIYLSEYLRGNAGMSESPSKESKLLMEMEDELSIEQILLYRSIARALHVRGRISMPDSLVGLRHESSGAKAMLVDPPSPEAAVPVENRPSDATHDGGMTIEDVPKVLSFLEMQCETARHRQATDQGDALAAYGDPCALWKLASRSGLALGGDDKSFDLTMDSKTLKTFKTTRSKFTRAGLKSTFGEQASTSDRALRFSFTTAVDRIEIMVVDEDRETNRNDNGSDGGSGDSDRMTGASDMSGLTEDQRDFEVQSDRSFMFQEEMEDGRVFASTDFLLFRVPENVVLRAVVSQTSFALRGRSGGSRNFNIKVLTIELLGENDVMLFELGDKGTSVDAPLHEVQLSSGLVSTAGRDSQRKGRSRQAFVLSLVDMNGSGRVVQLDTATLKGTLHLRSVARIQGILDRRSTLFPGRVLSTSSREEVRLYVLRQTNTLFGRTLSCSARLHGCQILLPDTHGADHTASPKVEGNYSFSEASDWSSTGPDSGLLVRLGLIEAYSGDATDELNMIAMTAHDSSHDSYTGIRSVALGDAEGSTVADDVALRSVRKMKLLDLPSLTASKNPSFCRCWVVAASGLDLLVGRHGSWRQELTKAPSLLESPIDLESSIVVHADSVLDHDNAKHQVVVEVSPVYLVISDKRLSCLAACFEATRFAANDNSSRQETQSLLARPPRLEVLSRLFRLSIDLKVGRLRLSLTRDSGFSPSSFLSKESEMAEYLVDFLTIASSFDLSFPHEEALSSAMQICIDRLNGIGLQVDEAWEATNMALLRLLEVLSEDGMSMASTLPSGVSPSFGEEADDRNASSIRETASRVVSAFEHCFGLSRQAGDSESALNHLVLDMPDGVEVSLARLFYDTFCSICVSSIFVTNSEGIHLLRITSPSMSHLEADDEADDLQSGASSDLLLQNDMLGPEGVAAGVVLRFFAVDQSLRFGRGGMPLSMLGVDVAQEVEDVKSELLSDVEVGDVEFLFSSEVFEEIITSCANAFSACISIKSSSSNEHEQASGQRIRRSALLSCSCFSTLFLADDMVPFCRLSASEVLSKGVTDSETGMTQTIGANALSVMNLTKEGEMYPVVAAAIPSLSSTPFFVSVTSSGDHGEANAVVIFDGFRVVFLRQFTHECVQFISSSEYGLGLLRRRLSELGAPRNPPSGRPTHLEIVFRDSSLIVPESCTSSNILCVEVGSLRVSSSRVSDSIRLPSEGSPLFVPGVGPAGEFLDCMDCLDDQSTLSQGHNDDAFSRTHVLLRGVRFYTSISLQKSLRPEFDSAAFRYFYHIDGRAEAGKPVYARYAFTESEPLPAGGVPTCEQIRDRRWQELTAEEVSFDVVVEHAAVFRLLVCDPLIQSSPPSPICLSATTEQFCLLLSVWYINMKEMPVTFPFDAERVASQARPFVSDLGPEPSSEEWERFMQRSYPLVAESMFSFESLTVRFVTSPGIEAIRLTLLDAFVYIPSEITLFTKVSLSARRASLCDESRDQPCVLDTGEALQSRRSWPDFDFGLKRSFSDIATRLPQQFMLSAFLAPKWSFYVLGINEPTIELNDFSVVSRFLEFVTEYFTDADLGHPGIEATERTERIKESLRNRERGSSHEAATRASSDFRLWMYKPVLSVPCDPSSDSSSGLRITSDGGLWYRIASFADTSLQEVASDNLSLFFDDRFQRGCQKRPHVGDTMRPLVSDLSLGVRVEHDYGLSHSDYAIRIPFVDSSACGIRSPPLSVPPSVVDFPTICSPFQEPRECMGQFVCEVTVHIDALPVALSALYTLFSTTSSEGEDGMDPVAGNEESERSTSCLVGSFSDIRVFALDPVLGPHLPVAVASVKDVDITMSQFDSQEDGNVVEGPAPANFQFVCDAVLWAQYFKLGLTRSWEPLVEPYAARLLYERSATRGNGICLSSDCPLHINVTSALLSIIDEVLNSFLVLVRSSFGGDETATKVATTTKTSNPNTPSLSFISSPLVLESQVVQQVARPLDDDSRVAFSLRNLTGQRIRMHRPRTGPKGSTSEHHVVSYVDHMEATEVVFWPTISVVRNLSIIEVDYPGLPNSRTGNQVDHRIDAHALSVQLPGFRWFDDLKVETFGRTFEAVVPRSELVLRKASDWRVDNVLKLLVEVGLEKGGRQVTLRSLFSVSNKTGHRLQISVNPDANYSPFCGSSNDDDGSIEPGDVYHVPFLLIENALRKEGSHMGSVWVRPSFNDPHDLQLKPFLAETKDRTVDVHYSSRPLELSKVVSETAILFEQTSGQEITPEEGRTAFQVSCPVVVGSSGDRLTPFCYAVEVCRSPVVKARERDEASESKRKVSAGYRSVHGPVAYSLAIHPPLVLVNLLPEKGRFELMHAVRNTVVWFGDLDPGQQVAVHSVGLDAPLLLLVNLGFCRTPVGEGALIHHGSDPPSGSRESMGGLKTLGKAGKAVTKQLGKTLHSLGDSPDRRGQDLLLQAQNPRSADKIRREREMNVRQRRKVNFGLENSGGSDDPKNDGKTYKVDTNRFFPADVAVETTVVDSIGQRLTLNIENLRGGGGQRRVSIFCPFWIVNTTEHALRYKQENSKQFVSGTVFNASKDGSRPLSGGRSLEAYLNPHNGNEDEGLGSTMNSGTIFSGTYGALATSPGLCELDASELLPLVDKNLPLDTLSEFAFMFNFHEGILSLGNQRLCVQLGDGQGDSMYISDWSRGVSLDSVGFSQVLSYVPIESPHTAPTVCLTRVIRIHCKDGRALELTIVVTMAPGALSGYTKIVRLLPRYLVVNRLPYPIRLWQDSSVFRPLAAGTADSGGPDFSAAGSQRNWRLRRDTKRKTAKINQYEALWGRQTVLDERRGTGSLVGTTAHDSAMYVTSSASLDVVPFNLPDSRGERQLRIGLGGSWNLTASFAADTPGEHTIKLSRTVDLRLLRHVSTRASPQYTVRIDGSRFSGELGIWFETEWGSDRSLIVKAVKKNSFAFNQTDVHIGDELLKVDGIPVSRLTFSEAMNLLRGRLAEVKGSKAIESQSARRSSIAMMRRSSLRLVGVGRSRSGVSIDDETGLGSPLTLMFRTAEDRLRKIRQRAARHGKLGSSSAREAGTESRQMGGDEAPTATDQAVKIGEFLRVELKSMHHMTCVVVGEDDHVPYRVENRTSNSTFYFRQKGCHGHPWHCLKPGRSEPYTWEEPLKAKRLQVRVSTENAFLDDNSLDVQRATEGITDALMSLSTPSSKALPLGKKRKVKEEEDSVFSPSIVVRLEEIGFREYLPVVTTRREESTKFLELSVDVVDSTRVLLVQDITNDGDEDQLLRHLRTLQRKCDEESTRGSNLRTLRSRLEEEATAFGYEGSVELMADADSVRPILDEATKVVADFPDDSTITSRHQLVVEVQEAMGLNPDSYVGTCNPYAEVYMKTPASKTRSLFSRKVMHKTYYVRKSVNPKWISQKFVFRVPEDAIAVTRGHALKIRIRNFKSVAMAGHPILGSVQVDLHSVRDQRALEGWFPLSGRTGHRELENPLSHWGRGSIRLKIQWIHSVPALLDYFVLLSDARLGELNRSAEGMQVQLEDQRKTNARRRAARDGFGAVRVNAIIERSKSHLRTNRYRRAVQSRIREIESSESELPSISTQGILPQMHHRAHPVSRSPVEHHSATGKFHPRIGKSDILKKAAHIQMSTNTMHELENMISRQRSAYHLLSARSAGDRRHSLEVQHGFRGRIPSKAIRSWVAAQALFSDPSLATSVDGDDFVVSLVKSPPVYDRSVQDGPRLLGGKYHYGVDVPSVIAAAYARHATAMVASRRSFELVVSRSIAAVLNPGGWLTIRPLTALNLPESYSGMYVKVRFGSETAASETVDARVYPTWVQPIDHSGSISPSGRDAIPTRGNGNDLHLYVPPQRTNGSIKLSVFGEKTSQGLTSRTELGVVYMSLGSTITCCVQPEQVNESSPVPYVMWFPLMSPRDVLPVEGDRGASRRPTDTEKQSDHHFHEYFTPCIQLAVYWRPDETMLDDDSTPGHDTQHSHRDTESAVLEEAFSRQLVKQYFIADIGAISAALIDSQKAVEILSFSMTDIDVRYWVTRAKSRLSVAIGWLQVDHQDSTARDPVVFAPTPLVHVPSVLQILAVKDNFRSKNDVLSFEFIDVSVAEFDLTVEEALVFDLIDFYKSILVRRGRSSGLHEPAETATAGNAFEEERSVLSSATNEERPLYSELFNKSVEKESGSGKVYIEQLYLGIVKVNLSYLKGKRQVWEVPLDTTWAERGIKNTALLALKRGESLGGIFSFHDAKSDSFLAWSQQTFDDERWNEDSVSDAPIRLQGKALNHVFEEPSEIFNSIRKFYVNETLRQIYKIIGSLDFVGNPTMLLNSFLSGVRDLVVAPSNAIMKSPTDPSRLGIGVAAGTLSLLSHSFSGFFAFASKLSATAGHSLASLSLDPEYRIWHRDTVVTEATNLNREYKRRGVQSVRSMVTTPIGDLVVGIGAGLSGLIVSPVRGFRRDGGRGLAKGVAVGVIGVAVRPTVGALDAIAHFTASIHDVAKSVNVLDKRLQPAIKYRLPYTFGVSNILEPYSGVTARATQLLRLYPEKKRKKESHAASETLVHVEVLPNLDADTFSIVTTARVILIKQKKDQTGSLIPSLCWQVRINGTGIVSSHVAEHGHNGFALTITISEMSKDSKAGDESVDEDIPPSGDSVDADGVSAIPSEMPTTNQFEASGNGATSSKKGNGYEWYTVLAEYQCRNQLVRLHNAISCVVRDFDAVIRDPSLGRPGSTEGYTSFGILYFEDTDDEVDIRGSAFDMDLLETIPWITEPMFAALEDSRGFEDLRRQWTIADELSAFPETPVWFKRARAEAALPTLHPRTPLFEAEFKSAKPFFEIEEADKDEEPEDRRARFALSEKFESARDTPLPDTDPPLLLLEPGERSPPRNSSGLSFHSTTQLSSRTALSALDPSLPTTVEEPSEEGSTDDDPTKDGAGTGEASISEEPKKPEGNAEESLPRPKARREAPDDHRLNRMEALMEQLLIFSSEQALARETRAAEQREVEALRREVRELRTQLASATNSLVSEQPLPVAVTTRTLPAAARTESPPGSVSSGASGFHEVEM